MAIARLRVPSCGVAPHDDDDDDDDDDEDDDDDDDRLLFWSVLVSKPINWL